VAAASRRHQFHGLWKRKRSRAYARSCYRAHRGYPNPGTGDRHVLVLDNSNCFLYELSSSYVSGNSWNAGSGAVWDLLSNEQRPYTWTSADAAGLPIFPGLARYDEVAAGKISHALRFTLQNSRARLFLPLRIGPPIPAI